MPVTISGTDGISIDGDPVATDTDLSALVTGKVLQVVSNTSTTLFTTTSSTYVDVTGWTATINPFYSNSKIYVVAALECSGINNRYGRWDLEFNRDSTPIWTTQFPLDDVYQPPITKTISYLDSPNISSDVTYSGRVKFNTGTNGGFSNSLKSITLLEIAA
jgi:hypothetical protein